jgi:hypothetical protein
MMTLMTHEAAEAAAGTNRASAEHEPPEERWTYDVRPVGERWFAVYVLDEEGVDVGAL